MNPTIGLQRFLTGRSLVGRGRHCWVRIAHPSVSSEHAMVGYSAEGWFVRDLGSRNGSWLNEQRLEPGKAVPLSEGANLQLGDAVVVMKDADEAPTLCIRPGEEGECLVAEQGMLSVPADDPVATAYETKPGVWVLEIGGQEQPLQDGDTFYIGETRYLARVPDRESGSHSATTTQQRFSLVDAVLRLHVSQDQESIETQLVCHGRTVELASRTTHQVLLLLASQRLGDRRDGIAEAECGWVYSADLARMLKVDRERVNIDIHRLRQQVSKAGIADAARLIERRPTTHQLRLGIGRAEISTW